MLWRLIVQSRGDRKRIIREATRRRIRAERAYLAGFFHKAPGRAHRRLEEADAITILKPVPNVAAYAAELGLEAW
jgi:hypothetical protein